MVSWIIEFADREAELNRGTYPQLGKVVGRGAREREGSIALGRVDAAGNCQTAHRLGLEPQCLYCRRRLLAGADELVNASLERGAGEYHYRGRGGPSHHLRVVGVPNLDSSEAVRVTAIEGRRLPGHQEEPSCGVLLDCEGDSRGRIRQHRCVRPLGSRISSVDVDGNRGLVAGHRRRRAHGRTYRHGRHESHQHHDSRNP